LKSELIALSWQKNEVLFGRNEIDKLVKSRISMAKKKVSPNLKNGEARKS